MSGEDYLIAYRLLCLKDGVVLKLRYASGEPDELVMTNAEAELLGTQLTAAARNRSRAEGVIGEAAHEAPAEPQKPCAGFRWIGQPFSSCDRCGLPYWEHSHEERLQDGAGPFSRDAMKRVPITPEDAAACRRRWGSR